MMHFLHRTNIYNADVGTGMLGCVVRIYLTSLLCVLCIKLTFIIFKIATEFYIGHNCIFASYIRHFSLH
jgi:hypothetical protein